MATTIFVIPRQSPRHKVIEPVTLVANAEGEQIMVRAATKDFSYGGLRVHSPVSLTIGQRIDVLFGTHHSDPQPCQVMWTKPTGSILPGEAGLKFLEAVGQDELREEPC